MTRLRCISTLLLIWNSTNLSTASSRHSKQQSFQPHESSSSSLVASAPLIVATQCSDGVALLALHTIFSEEPLLLDEEDVDAFKDGNDVSADRNSSDLPSTSNATGTNNNITTVKIRDIPRSYRGPFRIFSVDAFGTAIICAGWRSHAQMIADYCRDSARDELQVYGPPRMTMTYCREYGRFLSQQIAAWMAYTGVMRKFPWSCAVLLATCSEDVSNEKGDENGPGCVWLVDTNGTFRVRGHAIGGGHLSGRVNQYLISQRDELSSAEQTLRDLLDFLSHQPELVPQGTRAEFAVVTHNHATGKSRLKRIFTPSLFGVQSL